MRTTCQNLGSVLYVSPDFDGRQTLLIYPARGKYSSLCMRILGDHKALVYVSYMLVSFFSSTLQIKGRERYFHWRSLHKRPSSFPPFSFAAAPELSGRSKGKRKENISNAIEVEIGATKEGTNGDGRRVNR